MNIVKKYVFWIVLAVVLVGSGIVHFLVIVPIQEKTAELRSKAEDGTTLAKNLARKPSDIVTANHVKEALAYRSHLEAQEKELLSLWSKTAKFDMDARFANAPKDDIGFEKWLNELRNDIHKQVEQAGLELPSTFGKDFLYEGEPVDRSKIPAMVDRLAQLYEVLNILTRVKTQVPITQFDPDMKVATKDKQTAVGVLALNALRFYDNGALMSRDSTAYTDVLVRGGLKFGSKVSKPDAPFTRRGFSITVTLPFAGVPALIQALESNPRYLGVVRQVDMQRVASPYPNPTEIQNMAPGKKMKPEDRLKARVNTYYTEAPVQVLVDVDMLQFNQARAEKMATPPAPKSKARGRR